MSSAHSCKERAGRPHPRLLHGNRAERRPASAVKPMTGMMNMPGGFGRQLILVIGRCSGSLTGGLLALLLAAALIAAGCAGKKETLDDRILEWMERAEDAKGFTPSVLPPEEVREVYEEPVSIFDDLDVVPDRPLPDQRINLHMQNTSVDAILMLMARAADVNLVLSPGVHEIKGVSFKFENVTWDNAFRGLLRSHGLTYFWEGDVLQVYSLKDIDHDINLMERLQKHQSMREDKGRLDSLTTSVIRLRYLSKSADDQNDGTSIAERFKPLLSTDEAGNVRGSIHYDPDVNALIVHATRNSTNRIVRLLEHLDRPRPQVHIKAHIVETTKDTARDLGIQWGGRRAGISGGQPWMVSPGVGGPAGGVPIDPSTDIVGWPPGQVLPSPAPIFDTGRGTPGMAANFPANLAEGAGLSLGFIMGGVNLLEAQLSALQTERKANILSSPSITTLDNLTAFTETGEKVPYISMDDAGNPKVDFEDAVLRLEITPNVIDSSQLRLSILVKKDHVDDVRSVQGNPYIIKKETQTSLVASSGETIVISGLTEELSGSRREGVPWLMNIPGIGALFRRDVQGREMSEVLIFITATILPERPASLSQSPAPQPLPMSE